MPVNVFSISALHHICAGRLEVHAELTPPWKNGDPALHALKYMRN